MHKDDEGWDQAGSFGYENGCIRIGEAQHADRFDNRDI